MGFSDRLARRGCRPLRRPSRSVRRSAGGARLQRARRTAPPSSPRGRLSLLDLHGRRPSGGRRVKAEPTVRREGHHHPGRRRTASPGHRVRYCCVHAVFACATRKGLRSIMVQLQQGTVSTDYDTADRLYFRPLTAGDGSRTGPPRQSRGKGAGPHRPVRRPDAAEARRAL